jgi:hypothetical protein
MATFRLHGEFDNIDGPSGDYTLEQMLTANADDLDFCEWCKQAEVGDRYTEGFGDQVSRIA